ncbi:MAG: ATP-binding cassette domain-containing protein [Candidatus Odinarchaeota archaeon]|nr:ATP-binding cassette domain-containing protein [Candidatus Odinarchaeota archaeon]
MNERDEPIIKVEDVWFTYKGNIQALRGISLEIRKGEYIGLLGQNGSGKTTLAKHLNGLLKPTKGKVYVFGLDTTKASVAELSNYVGYVFQNPDHMLFGKTIFEEVSFGLKNKGVPKEEWEERVKKVLADLDMSDVPLTKSPHFLSLGQRHRVAIADVLVLNPEVLILDEPTTGLDYKRCHQLMRTITKLNKELGKTIIVISHDIALLAEYVDRIIILKDGKVLADGGTREILSQPDLLIQSNLIPPQITLLAQKLSDIGVPRDIIKSDELSHYVCNQIITKDK